MNDWSQADLGSNKMDLFLYREFCNHAYLGQWELARACALALVNNEALDNPYRSKLKQTLKQLAQAPSLVRNSWSAFPSPSYVSFFSAKLLIKILEDEEQDKGNAVKMLRTAEFNIMIEELFPKCTESQLLEISQVCSSAQVDLMKEESISLSPEVSKIIRDSLCQEPAVVTVFLNKFCAYYDHDDEVCDMYFYCLSYCLEHIETAFRMQDLEKVKELSQKIYGFLSLVPDFVLEKDSRRLAALDNIFLSVLRLVDSGCLELGRVYSSLISRESHYLLQHFCAKEDDRAGYSDSQNSTPRYLEKYRMAESLNLREVLLWSTKTNRHFLESILEYCSKEVMSGNYANIEGLLSQPLFIRLKPLIFILSWNACTSDSSFAHVASVIKQWQSSSEDDASLIETCKKFLTNISFKERCISYYNKEFPHAGSGEATSKACSIFSLAQSLSPLNALQKAFGLKNLSPSLVLDLLDCSSAGTEESGYYTEQSTLILAAARDSLVYRAYLAIVLVIEAILYSYSIYQAIVKHEYSLSSIKYEKLSENDPSISMENLSSRMGFNFAALNEFMVNQGIQAAYSRFVVEHLEEVKRQLQLLYPITFRVEVLENLFSLLFLSSEDLHGVSCNSDSDEGHEGDDKHSTMHNGSLAAKHDMTEVYAFMPGRSQVNSASNLERESVQFMIERSQRKRNELRERYSGHGSSRSTDSTGSSSVSASGFLCSELFVRDFLPILKDSVIGVNAEMFKSRKKKQPVGPGEKASGTDKQAGFHSPDPVSSVQPNQLQNRISQLQQYVNEAVWRYELVQCDGSCDTCRFKESSAAESTGELKRGISTNEPSKPKVGIDMGSATVSGTDNGSDGSSKRRRKRRKHRTYLVDGLLPDRTFSKANIIQRMLSSPPSLLRYCLWRQNHSKAFDVVNWYNLESSSEAEELVFSRGVHNLCEKVKKMAEIREKPAKRTSGSKLSSTPDLLAVANAAASGLQSSSASSVIDQEISQMKVPEIPEVSETVSQLSPSERSLFCGAENMSSLMLTDISSTQGLSLRSSSIILEIAAHQWKEFYPSFTKKNSRFTRGCLETMHTMLELVNCFQSISTRERSHSCFFPLTAQYASLSECLVNYFGPMDSLLFVKYLQVWKNVLSMVRDFRHLLAEDESSVSDADNAEPEAVKLFSFSNGLHASYAKLEKIMSELCGWPVDSVRPRPVKHRNYLKKLYVYLRQVANALICYKDQNILTGLNPYTSYFCVLKESPPEILRKMVMQKKMPPQKIEKFALSMKVDLAQVLLNSFFPHIPILRDSEHDIFHSIASKAAASLDQPTIVLNISDAAGPSPRHPDVAARELMKDFISIVQARQFIDLVSHALTPHQLDSSRQHVKLYWCRTTLVTQSNLKNKPPIHRTRKDYWRFLVATSASGRPHQRHYLKHLLSWQDVAIAQDTGDVLTSENIVSLLKHPGLASWMEDCSELAYVDLDLLQGSDELFAFFVNVTNIAWMHALLLAADSKYIDPDSDFSVPTQQQLPSPVVSPLLFERIIWQKLCGYAVGQLGVVSLFDLRYYFLHSNFPFPKHLDVPPYSTLRRDSGSVNSTWAQYALQAQSELIFVLCEGFLYSPKLQVMYSEIVSSQLEEAVKDYMDFYVKVDIEKKTVLLPQLLEWYCFDFDSQQGSNTCPYEGLMDWISSYTNSNLTESLTRLMSLNSEVSSETTGSSLEQRFEVSFRPASLAPGLLLSYRSAEHHVFSPFVCDEPEPFTTPDPPILSYINNKCPVVANLFLFSDLDTSSNEWPAISYTPASYHPITNLLKRSQSWASQVAAADQEVQSSSWLLSALNPSPQRSYTMQRIAEGIRNGQYIYSLYYLDSYMEFQSQCDASFTLARQIILKFMADSDLTPDSNCSDPYCWAVCIPDPLLRAENVLHNVHKWSEQSAVKALKFCLYDSAIKRNGELHNRLKTKLKEVELYEKILTSIKEGNILSEGLADVFSGWQVIAEYSTWDQHIVLNYLKECGQYHLVTQWANFNKIDRSARMLASAMQIISFLKQDPPNIAEAHKVFETFDSSERIELSAHVLPELLTAESKLHFVEFMLKANLKHEERLKFSNMHIGLKMVKGIGPEARERYESIVEHPKLILEQLLMNMEIKATERALQSISEDLKSDDYILVELSPLNVNQLLELYASKAVELPPLDNLSDSSVSSATILDSEEIMEAINTAPEQFVMPAQAPPKSEWVEDARVRTCQACKDEHFNMFSRRHHCRRCGRVVCSNCSQKTLIVEGYGKYGVRVCDDCYHQTVSERMSGSRSPSSSSLSIDRRYHMLSMKATGRSSSSQPSSEIGETKQRASSIDNRDLFYWVLTGNSEQDDSVRNEFFFDAAPSVSLCLSILKLHSNEKQCARFMITLCDRLIEKLQPKHSRIGNIKVDYSFVISMVRSFLVNAQVKCHQLQDHEGEALVDDYTQHLDIIKMLVNANCTHLIPKGDLLNNKSVRKLRDRLISEERMNLALDLSTNFGLDRKSVWTSWGISCLQSGDFETAREKFKQCLKVPNNPNVQKQESALLPTIINVLENVRHLGLIQDWLVIGSEKGSAISWSLSSLEQIQRGDFQIERPTAVLPDRVKEECLYYLTTYGTHYSVVSFYQRHNFISEALDYIQSQKCIADVFLKSLFIPMLKQGQLSALKESLTVSDVTLSKWWHHLLATCRYLEKRDHQNVLYQMQLFMQDYARAAKCRINFYLSPAESYDTLFKRYHHLHSAKKHFENYLQNYLEAQNYGLNNKQILAMPREEVTRYLQIIKLQEEVSHYFESCKSKDLPVPVVFSYQETENVRGVGSRCPPTLFGNHKKRYELAKLVLVNAVEVDEGFDLASKMVKECRMDVTAPASEAAVELVKLQKLDQLSQFLLSLRCTFEDSVDLDNVGLACISACVSQGVDAENIIKQLNSDASRITAYIICGKLKSAYLLAIRLNRADDVHRIMLAAKQKGQEGIMQQCDKWLQTRAARQRSLR